MKRWYSAIIHIVPGCTAAVLICFMLPGTRTSAASGRGARALMRVLPLFTAPNVPAMGPVETEAPPIKNPKPPVTGLPGKGMAQHPMLYVGEGYNKILLVNNGKII